MISASLSILFDTESTYMQKTERKFICPVLRVCCDCEAQLNDYFILLWKWWWGEVLAMGKVFLGA